MNRVCYVVYILACCFLPSCQNGLLISGKYAINTRYGQQTLFPYEHWFRFDKDSLYTYNYSAGFHRKVSNGKWYAGEKSNEIQVVSGFSDVHNIPITVFEEVSADTTTTFILDINLIPHTKWKLRVNGFDYWFSDNSVQLDHKIIVEDFSVAAYLALPDGDTTIVPLPLQDNVSSSNYIVSDTNSNLFRISLVQPVNFDIYYYTPINERVLFNKRYIWYKGMRFKRIR